MNLSEFHKNRQIFESQQEKFRSLCSRCLQPEFGCYCREIKPIDPKMRIVILIHPIEARRRIATGRMSHLCLANSRLIRGQNYSEDVELNAILKDPSSQSLILYPGKNSINLSDPESIHKAAWYDRKKTLNLFVIDGTWATARQMLRQSQNLSGLPRVSFSPTKLSQFRVRKQPAPECLATIEAIHQSIELLGPLVGFDLKGRSHDLLLKVFDNMVERQLAYINS